MSPPLAADALVTWIEKNDQPGDAVAPLAAVRRAWLIGRIYECLPLTFQRMGTDMKLIAFISPSARTVGDGDQPLDIGGRVSASPASALPTRRCNRILVSICRCCSV